MEADVQHALDNFRKNEKKAKAVIVFWLLAIALISVLFFQSAREFSKTQNSVDELKRELMDFKDQVHEDKIRTQTIFNEVNSIKESLKALNEQNNNAQRAQYVVDKYLKKIPLTNEDEKVLQQAFELKDKNGQVPAEVYLLRGVNNLHKGGQDMLVQAAQNFERALDNEKTQFVAHLGLGRVSFSQMDFIGAQNEYTKAFESPDKSVKANALVERGLTWVRLHSNDTPTLKRAKADYEEAIVLGNKYPTVYRRLGLVELRLGNVGKAKIDFERAIAESSSNRELASAIENKALISLHESQWEQAIAQSKQVLRVYPNSLWNWAIRIIAAKKADRQQIMTCSLVQWQRLGGNFQSAIQYYLKPEIWALFVNLINELEASAEELCAAT
jgi:tetratricopeptide (TPR) repeat protein